MTLTACGGDGRDRLPGELAERLARESDAVATTLERGDSCAADRGARRLRAAAHAAIAAGDVPVALRAELRRRVVSLDGDVVCLRPPAPPAGKEPAERAHGERGDRDAEDRDEGRGEDGGKDERRDGDEGKDERKDEDRGKDEEKRKGDKGKEGKEE